MPTINRSAGIWVGGYNPGGGYSGATEALDRSVEDDAKWMRRHFPGYGVEIRFNSDRRSGGAWLKGLGDFMGTRAARGWRGPMLSLGVGLNTNIDLVHHCYVDYVLLKDSYMRVGDSDDHAYPKFSSAEGAREWLLRNIDRSKVRAASEYRGEGRAERRE